MGLIGSPPRVRGIVTGSRFGNLTVGITPACAGNSNYGGITDIVNQDHPRVCGE